MADVQHSNLRTADPVEHRLILEARNVRKAFGGTLALADVTLPLFAGEVHALVGENGAGKSTFTKLLSGVHSPDRGSIYLDGEPVSFGSPVAARAAGVSIIFQEPTVFPDLTVAENVFVGQQPRRSFLPWIDRRAMQVAAQAHLEALGVRISPNRLARGLSVAELQSVEMASALTHQSRVLIVDEPTASLTPEEVKDLFRILRRLTGEGVAVLFVGHRLEEILAIADRITVLRDGEVVSQGLAAEYDEGRIIREMVGRSVESAPRAIREGGVDPNDVVLAVSGLSRAGVFSEISFELAAGRVTALAGLVGSGRSEIARAIMGIDRLDTGQILLRNVPIAISSPAVARRAGVAMVPEDRQSQGVATGLSVSDNITVPLLRDVTRLGFLRPARERDIASRWIKDLRMKAWGPEQRVSELSGGNQQKVSLAKWLATEPSVLILDEPTRGVDVGAKDEIHRLITHLLAEEGAAILLISSDLPEVLALADEIVVIREGRIAARLPGSSTAEQVMQAAVGNRDVSVELAQEQP